MRPAGELGGIRKGWWTQPSPQSSSQIFQLGHGQGSGDEERLGSPVQPNRASLG